MKMPTKSEMDAAIAWASTIGLIVLFRLPAVQP